MEIFVLVGFIPVSLSVMLFRASRKLFSGKQKVVDDFVVGSARITFLPARIIDLVLLVSWVILLFDFFEPFNDPGMVNFIIFNFLVGLSLFFRLVVYVILSKLNYLRFSYFLDLIINVITLLLVLPSIYFSIS